MAIVNKRRDNLKGTILERMDTLKITQEQLARKTNYSAKTISRRLNTSTDNWTKGDIKKIGKALGLTIDEIKEAFN